jgi:aminoglycoside 6-adenylyltransferase
VDHAVVLDNVVRWADEDSNIRVVVLEGSLARNDPSVDALSDLDLRLYVTEPQRLLETRGWYEQFGDVLVVEALANPGWHPTRLVYYVNGKIDFMIAPAATLVGRARFGRQVRVLLDKDALTATIAQGNPPTVSLPDEATFLVCVNEFYAAALMYARMLTRGEPIKAKQRDWDMKTRLVEMIAWDHVARYGTARDVRPLGGAFRQWADPEVAVELERAWGDGLDPSAGVLSATIELFRATSDRLARAMRVDGFDARAVIDEIGRILATNR